MAATFNSTTFGAPQSDNTEMMNLQSSFINTFRLTLPFTSDPYFWMEFFGKDFVKFIEYLDQHSVHPAGVPSGVITTDDLIWISEVLGDEQPVCQQLTLSSTFSPAIHLVTFKDGRLFLMVNGEEEIQASTALVYEHLIGSMPVDETSSVGAQPSMTPGLNAGTSDFAHTTESNSALTTSEVDASIAKSLRDSYDDPNTHATSSGNLENTGMVGNAPSTSDPNAHTTSLNNVHEYSNHGSEPAPYATPSSSVESSPASSAIPSGDCISSFNYTGAVSSTPGPLYATPSTSFSSSPAPDTTPCGRFDNSSGDHDAAPSTPTPAARPRPTHSNDEDKPIPQYKEIAREAYYNYKGANRPEGMIKFEHIYEYALQTYKNIRKRGSGFRSGFRHAVPKEFVKVEEGKKPDSGLWWTLDHDFKGDIAASNRRKPKVAVDEEPETPPQHQASESEAPETPRKRRATESEAPETPCKKSKKSNDDPATTMAAPVLQASGQQQPSYDVQQVQQPSHDVQQVQQPSYDVQQVQQPVQTQYDQYPQTGQQSHPPVYHHPDGREIYYVPATLNYQSGYYHPAQPQVNQSPPPHYAQQQIQQPAQPDADDNSLRQALLTSIQHLDQQASAQQDIQQSVEQPSLEHSVEQPSLEQHSLEQPSPEQSSLEQPSLEQPSLEQPSLQLPSPQQPSLQPSMKQPVEQTSSGQQIQQPVPQFSLEEFQQFQEWQRFKEFQKYQQQLQQQSQHSV